jgi:hypothetical protein
MDTRVAIREDGTSPTLEHRWATIRWQGDQDYVFCHPQLGTPLDPSKLARTYMKQALTEAGITKPFRPFHDLRHTSLTHTAAAGNPTIYVQARAGHAHASITERYLHATQTQFPDAVERSEQRIFGQPTRRTPKKLRGGRRFESVRGLSWIPHERWGCRIADGGHGGRYARHGNGLVTGWAAADLTLVHLSRRCLGQLYRHGCPVTARTLSDSLLSSIAPGASAVAVALSVT